MDYNINITLKLDEVTALQLMLESTLRTLERERREADARFPEYYQTDGAEWIRITDKQISNCKNILNAIDLAKSDSSAWSGI